MRIIAGSVRGKKIDSPVGFNTRPTTDRVRENIFNLLGPMPADIRVLDVFAGSGAMGLEALSRGAASAFFLEKERPAQKIIEKNIAACRFQLQAKLVPGDSMRLLSTLAPGFDLIFLDPPYSMGFIGKIEPLLLAPGFLNEEAVIVVETAECCPEGLTSDKLKLIKERKYGSTLVLIYKKEEN